MDKKNNQTNWTGISEGREKGNQRFITSPRPNVTPGAQKPAQSPSQPSQKVG
ncbi:MAG: hypothetical protein LBN06_08775 [Prevotellaceae bacterium]|jgi:hypothetical protein|nr:hypothetical protein [Prevotellaceae bacterium]